MLTTNLIRWYQFWYFIYKFIITIANHIINHIIKCRSCFSKLPAFCLTNTSYWYPETFNSCHLRRVVLTYDKDLIFAHNFYWQPYNSLHVTAIPIVPYLPLEYLWSEIAKNWQQILQLVRVYTDRLTGLAMMWKAIRKKCLRFCWRNQRLLTSQKVAHWDAEPMHWLQQCKQHGPDHKQK